MTLCYIVIYCIVLCYIILNNMILCYIVLYYVILYYIVLCYVMLYYVISFNFILKHIRCDCRSTPKEVDNLIKTKVRKKEYFHIILYVFIYIDIF